MTTFTDTKLTIKYDKKGNIKRLTSFYIENDKTYNEPIKDSLK